MELGAFVPDAAKMFAFRNKKGRHAMKLPLQITLRDISHSDAVEQAIRDKAEKLDQFYPQIMSCRVTVKMPGKHKHSGRQFAVRIDITVPGNEIVVNRERDEDVYVSLRDAFDAARRQLEDYNRKQRGDVKYHEPPPGAAEFNE